MSAGLLTMTPAAAAQLTSAQLVQAGFLCIVAGPHDWIHCLNSQLLAKGGPAIQVVVFSGDGSIFLGTEQLLREDKYAGQPCPQDDQPMWEPVDGIPYVACHHFGTH